MGLIIANAKAVVRIDENILEISSINKATLSRKYVVTILNENGIDQSLFKQSYDKFTRISSIIKKETMIITTTNLG